jgi:hypothetical protein
MKFSMKLLAVAVVSSAAALMHVAQAESTYGYNAAGTGTLTATAKTKITVNIPKIVLLRVGDGENVLTFNGAINLTGLTDGSNKTIDWDGVAPTFGNPSAQSLGAMSWTNAAGGAKLTCATVAEAMFGTNATDDLTSADITVASTGALTHPGTTTACGSETPIAKNTLVSGSWAYSISGAALAKAAAGTHTQVTTYTVTTL